MGGDLSQVAGPRQTCDDLGGLPLVEAELTADLIGEYSGELKEIRPITITTYQIYLPLVKR